jgi:membrane-bound lytic murein transglycosylase B
MPHAYTRSSRRGSALEGERSLRLRAVGVGLLVSFLCLGAVQSVWAWGELPDLGPAGDARDTSLGALVERLAADGFSRSELRRLFGRPELAYDPTFMGKKIRVLYRTRYGLVPPPPPPDPNRPKTKLYEPHLTPEMLAKIRVFQAENAATLADVETRYGVPPNVATAFLVVETKLGDFLGGQNALKVLSSMAVSVEYGQIAAYLDEYQPNEEQRAWAVARMGDKASWAYRELKALLNYAQANRLDPSGMPGSIYGAVGMCQFMPSNVLKFGQDGNGDGLVDLYSPADALTSLGYFLHKAGWRAELSREAKLKVIQRYNPDAFYARTILSVAENL